LSAAPSNGLPAPRLALELLAVSTLWGSSFLFVKLTEGALPPAVLAACRGVIGAATLAVVLRAWGTSLTPSPGEWRHWFVLGLTNGWLPNILLAFAMTRITGALGSMIQAAAPLLVALGAHLLFADERLSARRFLGVAVGLLGMGVLIGPSAFVAGADAAGALAMAGAALSYAAGNLYVRAIPRVEPFRLAFGQQLFSGGVALLLALGLHGTGAFAEAPSHLPALLALGVLATAAPMALFMRLIRRAGPTRAAMVGYLQPVVATLLGFAVLGEMVGAREVVGGAIVLAGVWLTTAARTSPPAGTSPQARP
jgi:drug/metabolite transporter (DMT)-like permease